MGAKLGGIGTGEKGLHAAATGRKAAIAATGPRAFTISCATR